MINLTDEVTLFNAITASLESDKLYPEVSALRNLRRLVDTPEAAFSQAIQLGWLQEVEPGWFAYDSKCWLKLSEVRANQSLPTKPLIQTAVPKTDRTPVSYRDLSEPTKPEVKALPTRSSFYSILRKGVRTC